MFADRYFLFNHEEAFAGCSMEGIVLSDGTLTLEAHKTDGILLTPVLDCMERGNIWQRCIIQSFLAEGITCRIYCADRQYEALAMGEMLADASLSPAEKAEKLERFYVRDVSCAEDFLLMGVEGRYMVMQIRFRRIEGQAPVIRQFRIFASEESFLRYLPEIYQKNGSFLDRFLQLFIGQYLELEKRIEELPFYFDPRVAPPDILRWLADIMGIENTGLWETGSLRALLVERTYARRGTLAGLIEVILIYTGFKPLVAERFRMITGLDDEIDKLYAGYGLTVLMPPESAGKAPSSAALHALVRDYISAGLSYRLITLDDSVVLSEHTYLGINTRLCGYTPASLSGSSRIQYVMLGE